MVAFAWDKIMGEPDDWDLLGALDKQKARATTAEKSRDEAIAELNKALETLGQLRSDLRKAEGDRDNAWRLFNECAIARDSVGFVGTVPDCVKYLDDRAQSAEKERDAFEKEATKQTVRAASAETDLGVQRARAQSAEDSLAKLREAAQAVVGSIAPEHIERRPASGGVLISGDAFNALRSLLDEPDKDQINATKKS